MNRTITIVATLALALLLGAGSVHAEETQSITFDAPFEFSIGDRTFPAGQYHFVRVWNVNTIYRIQGQGRYWGFVQTTIGHDKPSNRRGGAVFTRNGSGYELTSFSLTGYSGTHVPIAGASRRLQEASVAE